MTKENTVSATTYEMFAHNEIITSALSPTFVTPTTLSLKKGNTDWKQIAGKQDYEVYYVSYSYGIPMDVIRQVIVEYRTSRKRVYAILREMGYVIDTQNRRK